MLQLQLLGPCEMKEVYETYMVRDFPEAELKPLKRITDLMERGACIAVSLLADGVFAGYATMILPQQKEAGEKQPIHGLLDYFAVTEQMRGTGIGHEFFRVLPAFMQSHVPYVRGLFLEAEACRGTAIRNGEPVTDHLAEGLSPEDGEALQNNRERRLAFYRSCGCIETDMGASVFGVEYVIFYMPFTNLSAAREEGTEQALDSEEGTEQALGKEAGTEQVPGREALDRVYRFMFSRRHYQTRVKLWQRLQPDFYQLPARVMAPKLLGKWLCSDIDGAIVKYQITETECYCGEQDTACHASHGKTERTKTLYEPGGTAYVYLCYGMHALFNVVSGKQDSPEAALIRGITGYNGPGKLTKVLHIDRSLNGIDLKTSQRLWLEDDGTRVHYQKAKRVGIDYATKRYRDALWRFVAED